MRVATASARSRFDFSDSRATLLLSRSEFGLRIERPNPQILAQILVRKADDARAARCHHADARRLPAFLAQEGGPTVPILLSRGVLTEIGPTVSVRP